MAVHYRGLGIRDEEYQAIRQLLGRDPNECELRILGVMWSEHCSYKSTKHLLRRFPNKSADVVMGQGENAGVVKLDDRYGVAFKVESHNHPSAVAPVQGAATGVGGIIRDILALGARPTASMDGLFFGDPSHPKTLPLSEGIVQGVGSYGNCVGVPTVGGKTFYDACYNENPLVNAFCLGLVKLDELVSSQTARPGMAVVILGSRTGRDGIAGAAFASVELSEDNKESRPSIQIGDPFAEKLLIEACLELQQAKLIVSMQDMGAAGIVSSSSEIAAKSGVGMILDFDKIPLREEGMVPWEIALSESQERMLLIVEPAKVEQARAVADKWGLEFAVFGETVPGDEYTVRWYGERVAQLPASIIGDGCPEIEWPQSQPDLKRYGRIPYPEEPADLRQATLDLLASPGHADKRWIYEQYDRTVQLRTVEGTDTPVAVIRVPEANKLVAMTMEAVPWKCALDPYRGGAEVVASAVRALAIAGARPLGLTNCLNFPSPENPEQFWTLAQCVDGMSEASEALSCPVISGNVSLYNETASSKIHPTPVVNAVGVIDDTDSLLRAGQWNEGDLLFLAGEVSASLSGGSYLTGILGLAGRPGPFRGDYERDFCSRARETAREKTARGARPIAGGGLVIALAREAIASGFGAKIFLNNLPVRGDAILFGEGGPRALYAVPPVSLERFLAIWKGFPFFELGHVCGKALALEQFFSIPVDELVRAWRHD